MTRPETNRRRLAAPAWVFAGMFVLAALSQFKLQTVEREHTLELGKLTRRYMRHEVDQAVRGAILTSNGKPLAVDDDTSQLDVEFDRVPHCDGFYMDLSAACGISADEFAGAVASGSNHRVWKQIITAFQSEQVRKVKAAWKADGVSITRTGRREYPMGESAACLVGLVREGKPLMGLEASGNAYLKGTDGLREGLVDKNGSFLPMRTTEDAVKRRDGKSVVLTIDSDLQAAASLAVRDAVEKNKADNGVAIVISPTDGKVLAMANWPSFSPYNPDGTDGDLSKSGGYNPAYMSALEPGSMFKILTLAKALDEHKVSLDDHIYCSGEMHVDGIDKWKIHCDDHKAHNDVTPQSAIARSCNIAAATWALKIGRTDFLAYLDDLGLLSKTHLGLPKEGKGQYARHDWAERLQLANMGFGQALIATPLALADAFSIIANGGVRVEPTLIEKIGGRTAKPGAQHRIIRPETAEMVRKCMETVIESDSGTGKSLRIPGYRLAGKTGTAQKIGKHGGGYVSNFVGFVPAQSPRAVVLVMINHPTGAAYHGAAVAGPVFVQIARSVIQRYAIPPTEPVLGRLTMNR